MIAYLIDADARHILGFVLLIAGVLMVIAGFGMKLSRPRDRGMSSD